VLQALVLFAELHQLLGASVTDGVAVEVERLRAGGGSPASVTAQRT
jgi:hypothetical protein